VFRRASNLSHDASEKALRLSVAFLFLRGEAGDNTVQRVGTNCRDGF
jgi:hypothetical protein